MKIAVIIPAYGPTPYLDDVLTAIGRGSITPGNVIVSHSGTDDPAALLGPQHPDVTFLHSDERLYAGAARNRGQAAVESDILAFCDSDVVPDRDWLKQLSGTLLGADQVFAVGAVGVERTGGYWGMSNYFCEFSEQAPFNRAREQGGGASCNMAVRAADFANADGFDDHQKMGEDTLLFASLRRASIGQRFVPTAVVRHYNISGLRNLIDHQRAHGRHFVKTRLQAELPGSVAIRHPWLAPALPIAKFARIAGRLMMSGWSGPIKVIYYLPGLLAGMAFWSFGLFGGLSGAQSDSDG